MVREEGTEKEKRKKEKEGEGGGGGGGRIERCDRRSKGTTERGNNETNEKVQFTYRRERA